MSLRLKILLVDGDPEERRLIGRDLRDLGHDVFEAGAGAAAIEAYRCERPDVVVTDLDLPDFNGYQLVGEIKRLAAPSWQPVLLLSHAHHDDAMLRAMDSGADAYFDKRVSPLALDGWLRAMGRTVRLQREVEARSQDLVRYYDTEQAEKRLAQHLMARLINAEKLNDVAIRHWVAPAQTMSGDVVAAARAPGHVLHILLADGTGHGLSASLNVLPIIAPFYRMTEKGFGIGAIARELNAKLHEIMPTDRFVAATLAAIDFRERVVQVWNGGNPATYLLGRDNAVKFVFVSTHLPLGLADEDHFDDNVAFHPLTPGCQLVLFSDGLIEAENEAGQSFGEDRLASLVVGTPAPERLLRVKEAVADHLAGKSAHDDISLVLVNCDAGRDGLAESRSALPRPTMAPGAWRFSVRFGPVELRGMDVVPLLIGMLANFESARMHTGVLFGIISELFNNALDHGLLGLASALKHQRDGMDAYFASRANRLAELQAGSIDIELEHGHDEKGEHLIIVCRDSGVGFDYKAVGMDDGIGDHAFFGRGLKLVRSQCRSLHFNAAGNEARAVFAL